MTKSSLHKVLLLFVALIIMIVTVLHYFGLLDKYNYGSFDLLPIETVQIEAPFLYTTEESVSEYLIEAGIDKASFLNINMSKMIKSLKQNPWISNIQVSRVWPNKIKLKYSENSPLAYLNDNEVIIKDNCKAVLLTNNIKTAVHKDIEKRIPVFPTIIADKKNLKKLCDTLEKIEIYVKPINNRVKKLVLSQRDSLYLELDNGITVLLGKKNILERVERFVSFISKFNSGDLRIGKDASVNQINNPYHYIDMRYHSGLAVGRSKGKDLTELMETA